MHKLFFGLISLSILLGCKRAPDLFFINDREDFLYMVESTNVPPLRQDSANYYLGSINKLKSGHIYRNFGVIEQNGFYSANVFLVNDTLPHKRDYEFLLITYDDKHNVIDSYSLATLDDNTNKLCVGSINSYLTISTICGNTKVVKEIDAMGNIREYSSW
ncbi:hypothetical protein ACE01N_19900 [Saccharicrinis sp. FJH2]|uniref:hypothetical protein n=1 Tax=Saccharicrinis sp. FJH65 TaxID=3344659 RepID=UPI0035F30E1E